MSLSLMFDTLNLTSSNTTLASAIIGVYDPARTGNAYVDGVMSGYKWPAGTVIHYGFPTTPAPYPIPYDGTEEFNHNFVPVSQFAQETIDAFITGARSGGIQALTLTPIMGFTNLTLAKDPTAIASTHMLIATSSDPSSAWAYYPGSKFGVREGDVWLGQRYADYITPANGSYGSYIMIHEVGHALGLKHSFDLDEQEDVTVPFDADFFEYTVMSYSGAPYVVPKGSALAGPEESFSYAYPQTYMMLDIAALQEMYGANYTFRSNDTTYTWSPTTGEVLVDGISQGREGATDGTGSFVMNQIFQTIWDGGGTDTYDLSNYTADLKLDLRPGEYSTFSQEQRAWLGYFPSPENYSARGNVYNALLHHDDPRSLIENAKGGSGNDALTGNIAANHLWGSVGDDTLAGGAGADTLEGGNNLDTAVFSGNRANYTITHNDDGSITITDSRTDGDGVDILFGVEIAQFNDGTERLVINRAPSDLRLAGHTEIVPVQEGNTILGDLSASDADGDTVAWSFEDTAEGGGNADGMFVIENGQVKLAPGKVLDFESDTRSYTIHVNASDGNGGMASKTFIINVGDVQGEQLIGTAGADTLRADIGRDVLNGLSGADTMIGGVDNDTYYVENAGDRVIETAAGGTADLVYTAVSHTLTAYVERLIATGSGALTLTGNGLGNTIIGNAGRNHVNGGAGNDTLFGGLGNDTLSGGSGRDAFVFNTTLNRTFNVDTISNFSVRDDTIRLENALFKKLGKAGNLNKDFFTIYAKAKDKNDYIVYDNKTGALYYDADGSGRGAAIKFAQLSKGLHMTNADFLVV